MNPIAETERIANQFFAEQSEFMRRENVTTPERIGAAYEAGALIGAVTDNDELPHDLRQFARNCRDEFRAEVGVNEYRFATASGTGSMYGDYEGQLIKHYQHYAAIDPAGAYKGAQKTGDCFVADTKVLMSDGSEKSIQDVQVGEYVLSRTGVPRRVLDTVEKPYSGELLTLQAKGYAVPVTCTPDHRFTTITNVRYASGGFKPRKGRGNAWVAASDIDDPILLSKPDLPVKQTVFDLAGISDEIGRASSRKLTPKVPLDERLGWLIGLYLAEGSCEAGPDGEPIRITFNLGRHEGWLVEKAKGLIKDVFGVDARVNNLPSKPTVTIVRISSKAVAILFKRIVSGNQWNKCVPPCLFSSMDSVRMSAIRGWFDGDGHVRINESESIGCRSISAVGVSASGPLLRGMFRLMLSCGVKPAFRMRKKESHQRQASGGVHAYGINALQVYPEFQGKVATKSMNPELHEWGMLAPIESRSSEHVENATVYCLHVEEEHSFIANGYAVHNCVSWSKRTMRDMARCYDIGGLKQSEEYVKRSATADLYAMRGHTGAGASPSRIAIAATKIGILLEGPIESPDGEVWDFTDYNRYYRWGMDYGRTGLPQWIYEANREFGPKQVAEVSTESEFLTALWNGCGIGLGSMMGVSKTGGKDGVKFLSSLSGSWAHDMAVIGADTRKKYHRETIVLMDQSWGPRWNNVSGWPEEYKVNGMVPEGMFAITISDFMKHVRRGECHALSDSHGFRPRRQASLGATGLI